MNEDAKKMSNAQRMPKAQNDFDLEQLAVEVMEEKGLQPEFPKEALQQLGQIRMPAERPSLCKDMRSLLWCSIDNDDSMDLDQLTYAEKDAHGNTVIWVAVADVDALVEKGTPIDLHAEHNTTSVYTPARIFSMLPTKLSTDLTSLNENEIRVALVVEVLVGPSGDIEGGTIFQGWVNNHAKLAYNALGDWLEGHGEIPEKVRKIPGLEKVIRLQNEVAQLIKIRRHKLGALTLEPVDAEAKVTDDHVVLELPRHNLAHQLIENFMIAANHIMAHQLGKWKLPSLRRVVRVPKRWDRIVEVAKMYGDSLPLEPDSKALENFLVKRRKADPESFPDLSLVIIKLLGRGEYVVQTAENAMIGHFGLALREYVHSTAPNRRYPDLITQRQCKAHLLGRQSPYKLEELQKLAAHCTDQEDAATKVERHMNKSAAAVILSSHIGEKFKAIVTGVNEQGTWARIFDPPTEGKIIRGFKGLDVGDRVTLQLIDVDIPKGYINFLHRGR